MRTNALWASLAVWLAFLGGTSSAAAVTPVDKYGGVVAGAASATGYFQVKQVGNRWLFVTPEGNGLWMTGVYGVIYSTSVDDLGTSGLTRIVAKYGSGTDWQNLWRINTARRLWSALNEGQNALQLLVTYRLVVTSHRFRRSNGCAE